MNQACIWTLVVLAVVVVAALIAIGVIVGLQQQQQRTAPNLAARLADVGDEWDAIGYAAPRSSAISAAQAPRLGVPSDSAALPVEVQAQAVFDSLQANPPNGGCFAPLQAQYNAQNALMQENDAFVPSYQQVIKNLPATQQMNLQQQWGATNIGPQTREGIDQLSAVTLDAATRGPNEDFDLRVQQTEGAGGASVAKIYAGTSGAERKGISLINQKSRMTDPSKLLPRVDPSRQSERLVQAGPSIADIARRVPQAADIMKSLKAARGSGFGGSALAQQLPRDKPPLYTQGLNAFR
jgi:hypothetical protein